MTPNSISPPESKKAVDVLNRCLEAVGSWMWENKLKLNSHKTEVFLVWKSMARVLDYCPALTGVALSLKEQVHSLGVLLDLQLLLESQVSTVASSTFAQLRLLCQLRLYLSHSNLATSYI